MKRLTQIPLDDGTPIYIEVDEPEGGEGFRESAIAIVDSQTGHVSAEGAGFRESAVAVDKTVTLATTLEQSFQAIKPAVAQIKSTLDELNHPDAIEVQFGIKIVGGVGAVFASTSTEANFTIKLNWNNTNKSKQ